VHAACCQDHRGVLAPGERGLVAIVAADRAQSRIILNYIKGLLGALPELAELVLQRRKESIDLVNNITIEIRTASFKTSRGYTLVFAAADEAAYWPQEGSANPDVEVLRALRPGLATTGGRLWVVSTPYAKRGVLWDAFRRHYGQDDAQTLVWKAETRAMNPLVSEAFVAEQLEADPEAASAEGLAEFRADISALFAADAVRAVTVPGRRELAPAAGPVWRYAGFADPSGGSADAFTLAISHAEGPKIVLDAVRERRPPFSPDAVCEDFAALLKTYGIAEVTGDRYAGEWPRERFAAHGIRYRPSEKTKSQLYTELLPLVNAGRVELLDLPRLVGQLVALERRTSRPGQDSIDHGPGGHDDIANAAAGALGLVGVGARPRTPAVGPVSIPLASPFDLGRGDGAWHPSWDDL